MRVAAWGALALFGVWLGMAIKLYWVIGVFVAIALLGGALELAPMRGSRGASIQAGIVGVVLLALTAIAAIAGVAVIADELQGVSHRPWRRYSRLVYDPVRDAFGSMGGALFWMVCFGVCLIAVVRYLRKLFGKGETMPPNSALLTDAYTSPLRAQRSAAKRER
jgi:hypothetical protein